MREWDETTYVVWYNGDLFRAFHSEVAGTDFVSVQMLEPNNRKYSYIVWKLSPDGQQLRMRSVSSKVVPKETKDSAAIQELLKKNLQNPELFNEEALFAKEKQTGG